MKIKKTFQGTIPENKILNSNSTSQTDTYSCEKINEMTEEIYSTEEVRIGKWIDGKPLYRKVIDFGSLPNNAEKYVNIGVSNLERVINIYGYAVNGNYGYELPFINPRGATSEAIGLYKNQENISIITGIDRTGYSAYVILEYTKTTD